MLILQAWRIQRFLWVTYPSGVLRQLEMQLRIEKVQSIEEMSMEDVMEIFTLREEFPLLFYPWPFESICYNTKT